MPNIGVIQGRMLPPFDGELQGFPRGRWAEEFPLAAHAGLDCIEWIFDCGTEAENPIWTEGGEARLRELAAAHGVAVRSVCADYFMRRPLLDIGERDRHERVAVLLRLIDRAALVGANRVVIPFVDGSSISGTRDRDAAADCLRSAAAHAARRDLELHLETDLGPWDFAAFLDLVDASNVKVNYDSGNSAALGYAPAEELAAYGDRLGSVHIKDRVLGGGSVPLGTGSADFPALFGGLRRLGYNGDFILQTARGAEGDELALARRNRALVETWIAG